ncbi:MAG: L-type lectin-domain containing protein [Chitinophagales bacterium]
MNLIKTNTLTYTSQRFLVYFWCILLSSHTVYGQFGQIGATQKVSNQEYLLTPSQAFQKGAIWNDQQISLLRPFKVDFQLYLGCDRAGGDGVAFVFQQSGKEAIGGYGSSLGYGDISPSLVVEFDSHQSGYSVSPVKIAISRDGDNRHNSHNSLTRSVIANPDKINVIDCEYHDVSISWQPQGQLIEVYFDGLKRVSYSMDVVEEIFSGKPLVYWGFTAGTGMKPNEQKIRFSKLSFDSEPLELAADVETKMPKCHDSTDGLITVFALGGAGQYQYKWSHNPYIEDATVGELAAGVYTVTISDKSGQHLVKQIELGNSAPLQIVKAYDLSSQYTEEDRLFPWEGVATGGVTPYFYTKGSVFVVGESAVSVTNHNNIHVTGKPQIKTIQEGEEEYTRTSFRMMYPEKQMTEVPFIKATDIQGCETTYYLDTIQHPPFSQPFAKEETYKTVAYTPTNTKEVNRGGNKDSKNTTMPVISSDTNSRSVAKYNEEDLPIAIENRTIDIDKAKRVVVKSNTLEIAVWDGEYIDGDVISLYFNGQWILEDYALRKQKKRIKVRIDVNEDNHLILFAHNLGERSPNTAAVSINDGTQTKRIGLSSNLNQCDAVQLILKN